MARNAIESDFRSSTMAAGSHLVKTKLHIDLKWREMPSKGDFLSFKMAAGSHFIKKLFFFLKLRFDLKWREMRSNVTFGHPKF